MNILEEIIYKIKNCTYFNLIGNYPQPKPIIPTLNTRQKVVRWWK